MDTVIVIPCYNESDRLDVSAFEIYLDGQQTVHFIFVNDGSTDRTWDTIERIRRAFPEKVMCLNFEKNSGKAEAVRAGVLAAIAAGYDKIGYWDADLATPLTSIDEMSEKLNHTDYAMVLGSRVKLLGHEIHRKAVRHYVSRFFATGASMVINLPVYDTQCGAKLFRNNADFRLAFQEPFNVRWSFDVELLGRLELIRKSTFKRSLAFDAFEYPLPRWVHVKGSKVKLKDFLVGSYELAKILFLLRAPFIKVWYKNQILSPCPTMA